jgi:phosphoglycerate dehydrogenase-like enzyme
MADQHPVLFLTHRGERHQQAALGAAPAELVVTMRRSPTREEVLALIHSAEFLVTERTGDIDAGIIAAGKKLRLIQRLGSRTYDIDLGAARCAGVPVCYLPVRGCINVAEHMLLQMLALSKRLREQMDLVSAGDDWGRPRLCDEDTFAYNWTARRNVRSLWGSTVGILGFGEIGAELARLLKPFGCRILYTKRTRLPEAAEAEYGVQFSTNAEIAASSDSVCMLLPYFEETRQSLGGDFFSAMKPGAFFVSCGGSGVVDETALASACAVGHLGGAALDTFTNEPVTPDDPMVALARDPRSNVVLTPHTAAGAEAANRIERQEDYDNLLRALRGEPLVGRVA